MRSLRTKRIAKEGAGAREAPAGGGKRVWGRFKDKLGGVLPYAKACAAALAFFGGDAGSANAQKLAESAQKAEGYLGVAAYSGGGQGEDINTSTDTNNTNDGGDMVSGRRVLRSQGTGGGPVEREAAPKVDTAQEFKDILADLGFNEREYRKIMEEGDPETIKLLVALHAATEQGAWDSAEAQMAREQFIAGNVSGKIMEELGEDKFSACEADVCIEAFGEGYDTTLASRMVRAAQFRGYDTDDALVRAIIVMGVRDSSGKLLVSSDAVTTAEESVCGPARTPTCAPEAVVQDWKKRQAELVPSRAEAEEAPVQEERGGVVPSRTEEGPERPGAERQYPPYIIDKTIQDMLATFEEETSDYNLEKIQMRTEYLVQKGSSTRADSEDDELAALGKWLEKLGLGGAQGSMLDSITEMRRGFFAMQSMYYESDEGGTELLNYLRQIKERCTKELFLACKKYLSGLDANAGKLFIAVKPESPKYIEEIGEAMQVRLSEEKVKAGRASWVEYFSEFSAEEDRERFSPAMQYALSRVATLSPLLASSFYDYLDVVQSSDLSSPEERKMVVRTAAQLYAVTPFLVGKYFQAIANLARVCEDNREAFADSMAHFSAKIESVAGPMVEEVSALQFMPSNIRTIVTRLDNALGEVSKIPPSALSQYDRFNLMDDFIYRDRDIPHPILQREPLYAPQFLSPMDRGRPYTVDHPFPEYMQVYRPTNLFSAGAVSTSPERYKGTVVPPRFNLVPAVSHTLEVKGSLESYLWPTHTLVSIGDTIPGVSISGLSPTRLLMEIDRAFIPTERPEYSMQPLGGGAVVGGEGKKYEETGESEYEVGGMGTYITPTGGLALGGTAANDQRVIGGTAIGVPVGKVPIARGLEEEGGVGGIDSMIAGYEEIGEAGSLDETEKRLLLEAIATKWNAENPGQLTVTVNREENVEGRSFMTARTFFVEKDGTIYEFMGGESDFIDAHNFIAGYGNKNANTPTTYAWNVEPTIDRGGGAVAWDAGDTGWLAHVQAVPFYTSIAEGRELSPEEKPMPLLFQWTPAASWTKRDEKEAKVSIISAPGSRLELEPSEEDAAQGRPSDKYLIQDVRYRMRYIKEKRAWELSMGGGLGRMEVAGELEEGDWESRDRMIGRGGFFLKTQSREDRYSRSGGGLFYEGGATNLMALALLNEAEEDRRYVESLHRIGATVYGGKRASNDLVLGGLAHMLEQLREMGGAGEEEAKVSPPDARGGDYEARAFYRLIGIIKGLRNVSGRRIESESGVKLDVMRSQGLERILQDYDSLSRNLQHDPRNASHLINQFRERNSTELRQIFDYYSIGTRITRNFSMQGVLVAREKDNMWVEQEVDRVHARQLWTFKLGKRFGFERAWASVPLIGRYMGGGSTQNTGLLGAGMGIDLFRGRVLPRIAGDAGLVLARGVALYEMDAEQRDALNAAEAESPGTISEYVRNNRNRWDRRGHFVQGAVLAFSNVLEDSNEYRNLVEKSEEYRRYIRSGRFSKLPPGVRKRMCDGLDPGEYPESGFSEELLKKIRKGEDLPVRYDMPKKGEQGLGPEEIGNMKKAAEGRKEYEPYMGDIGQGTFSRIPPKLRTGLSQILRKGNFPAWVVNNVARGKDIPLKKDLDLQESKWVSEYEVQELEDSLWVNDFLGKKIEIQKKFDGHFRNYYAGSMYDMGTSINWDVGTFLEWVDGMKDFRLYTIYSKKGEGSLFAGASAKAGGFELEAVSSVPLKNAKANVVLSAGYGWKRGEFPMKLSASGFHLSTKIPEYTRPYMDWPAREVLYSEWGVVVLFTMGLGGVPYLPMSNRSPAVPAMGQEPRRLP